MIRNTPGALPDDPTPHHLLAEAIRRNADEGRLPRCAGSDLPTSDDADDRAAVARLWCPRCPVRAECEIAGQSEVHGVFGGVDRSRTASSKEPRR